MATDSRQWVVWAYKLHGCADCGAKPVQAGGELTMEELQCHHRDPRNKGRHGVAGACRQAYDVLFEELAKCDVVCADCHKARHRNGHKGIAPVQVPLFSGLGDYRYYTEEVGS
jgi:hypothetical protein